MAKKPKDTTTTDYTVVRSDLHYDGDVYTPGSTVALTEAEARPRLAVNAIAPPSADPPAA